MRLSEAIMLGSATCRLVSGDIDSCAIGCALNAEGVARGGRERYHAASRNWPWIGTIIDGGSGRFYIPEAMGNITRRFDNFVCEGTMTLEQLADYVRSIEPDCDCNRFNCDCKSKQEAPAEVEHAHQT